MWTVFCAGRWMCLLMLAGAMLPIESKGNKIAVLCYMKNPLNDIQASLNAPCCRQASGMTDKKIIKCIKQKPTRDCNSNDYAVQTEGGTAWYCIRSDSKWMKKQIESGKVNCPKVTGSSEQE